MAEKSMAFGTPEVVSNYKKNMGQGMAANAFRRLFPNWDSMGEEQRAEALGEWEGQKSRKEMDIASIRAKAFREGSAKGRPGGLGGMSATGIT
jgi:hypothetical protein